MAKTLKFLYAIIVLFSLFLLSMEDIAGRPCETDEDCPFSMITPNMLRIIFKCVKKVCTKFQEVPLIP
ncbi:nodulin-3-like [Vicia villosa]|uniref:nodulin-3-like n=1 Tax=Vicia villosa TaxID=3911 RepID=UPI00273CC62E|nr:nodulin-3-like [Vicia villosa]